MVTALLIIDVQTGFINEHTQHVVQRIERLQHQYSAVFATQFINPKESFFRKLINWHRFSEGSPDIELAFRPVTWGDWGQALT